MSDARSRRLLVVANRTESTPQLLDEIGRRARAGAEFTLMVPPERDPDAPDWTDDVALELVQRAAHGRPVTLVPCGDNAALKVHELVKQGACDEILLCTPAEHHKLWHRHSLPDEIQKEGIPVKVIPPDPTGWSESHGFPDEWVRIEVGPLT